MQKDKLGATLENETIVIDYGGPNVAKPLHVGHLRTAIIGQAINNILKFKGNHTIGDVHLGDIGAQMGQVIYGILNDFPNTKYEDIEFDLNYLNVTYPKMSALCKEDENVRKACAEITKKLQEGDPNYHILWEKIYKLSVSDIKRIYDYLDVHFDYWYGESDAYKVFPEMMFQHSSALLSTCLLSPVQSPIPANPYPCSMAVLQTRMRAATNPRIFLKDTPYRWITLVSSALCPASHFLTESEKSLMVGTWSISRQASPYGSNW